MRVVSEFDFEAAASEAWLRPRQEHQGLQRYVETIRERLWMIVGMMVLTVAAAAVYVALAPRLYSAESDILITPVSSDNTDLVGLGLITDTSDPTRDTLTGSKLVTTAAVARLAAQQLGLKTTPDALLSKVSVNPVASSNIVAIDANALTPAQAEAIANAFANATIADRTNALHAELDQLLPLLRTEVAQLPPADRAGPGSLGEHLALLETLRQAPDPTLRIENLAQPPTGPSSPRTKLILGAAIIAGLILGLAAAFGSQSLDPRLRREDQLRELYRIPLLARIPRQRRRHGPIAPGQMTGSGEEAYRTLRATMQASTSSSGSESRAVLVTGSSPGEGKTTTALNLATSLASAGHQVILIEADMRRPTVGAALQMTAPYGIASVLIDQVSLLDALVWTRPFGPKLEFLLVDQAGPHMADRLSLPGARSLIDEAKRLADYVIIDSPPLTEVIDVLPLAQQADDVLLVARLGKSKLNKLTDLGEILLGVGIRPVGIAMVGVERENRAYYYYYDDERRGASRNGWFRGRGRHQPDERARASEPDTSSAS